MKKILILIALCLMLTGCKKIEYPVSKMDFVLNTFSSIDIYAYEGEENPEDILNECFLYIRELEKVLSRTVDESEISKLNNAGGAPVEVSEETRLVLESAVHYSEISDGAFDVTVGAVSSLWDFVSGEKIVPESEKIADGLKTVGYENISINGNLVALSNNAQLDLGAIAKGYIADKTAEFLVERGVTSAIVNLGGNNVVIGNKDGSPFKIGIQNPTATTGEYTGILSIENMSVVTSGAYQRFFVLDGKTYHHILNPKTGYPAESDIASVSIICEKSIDADALSTSCFILGVDEAVKFMDSLDYACAVIITTDGETILTNGAEKYYEPYIKE